jgi:hypothetical protein
MDRPWMILWLAGAALIGIALPLAAVMVAIDHRRHRDWLSTCLAATWCVLAAAVVGVQQGNMSPPLFGVPLVLLYAVAWTPRKAVFTFGVAGSYCLSACTLYFATRRPSDLHWGFLLAWLASLVALVAWRARRPSGTPWSACEAALQ